MTEQLRVVVVTPRFAPDLGGVETHVRSLTTELAARGHVVTVLTQAARHTIRETGRSDRADGVFVHRFPLPLATRPDVPSPALLANLRHHLLGADVVHAHSYHALPALGVALGHGSVPFVLTPHYHGTGHTPSTAALHHVYRPLGSILVRRAAAVVAVSAAELDLLERSFGRGVGQRTTVIPNGVRHVQGAPFLVPGPVVLSVGRLECYKRVDLLVRALAVLPDQVRLVVVGDGPARAALQQLACSQHVAHRVTFTGSITDDELARWRATASTFATVSTREAYGICLAESLTAGLPCVASGIPAHQEIAAQAHGAALLRTPVPATPGLDVLADGQVVDELAAALRRLLWEGSTKDPSPGALWGWPRVASATEELYREVVSGAAPSRTAA